MLNTNLILSLQNIFNENLKEIKRLEQYIANNNIDLYDIDQQRSLSSDLVSFLTLQQDKLSQHPLILKTISQLQKQLHNIENDNSILQVQLQKLKDNNSELIYHLRQLFGFKQATLVTINYSDKLFDLLNSLSCSYKQDNNKLFVAFKVGNPDLDILKQKTNTLKEELKILDFSSLYYFI